MPRADMDLGTNSWTEHRREILKSLIDLDNDIHELGVKVDGNHNYLLKQIATHRDELQQRVFDFQTHITSDLTDLRVAITADITALKTKASTWGSVWGAISATVITIIISAIFQTVLRK